MSSIYFISNLLLYLLFFFFGTHKSPRMSLKCPYMVLDIACLLFVYFLTGYYTPHTYNTMIIYIFTFRFPIKSGGGVGDV